MRKLNLDGRFQLGKKDSKLYKELKKRGLLAKIKPKRERNSWKEMDDEELVRYAQKVMKEQDISRSVQLVKSDNALYQALRKRKVLDRVFAPLEQSNRKQALDEIVEAVNQFGVSRKQAINEIQEAMEEFK